MRTAPAPPPRWRSRRPLLEASIEGAHGVLLSIAGGSDLGLFEVSAAANLIESAAHEDANIIFGTVIDDALGDEVRVTVIAAGFDGGLPQRKPSARPELSRREAPAVRPAPPAPPAPVAVDRPAADPAPFAEPAPRPAPRPVPAAPDLEDDLDVPDFLK